MIIQRVALAVILMASMLDGPSALAQTPCADDRPDCQAPLLKLPYSPEYLATTPEKIDVAGPGCVKGQTNPRLPGTCGPVGSATPGGRTCPGAVDSSAPSRIQAPPRRSSPAWWRDTQGCTATSTGALGSLVCHRHKAFEPVRMDHPTWMPLI